MAAWLGQEVNAPRPCSSTSSPSSDPRAAEPLEALLHGFPDAGASSSQAQATVREDSRLRTGREGSAEGHGAGPESKQMHRRLAPRGRTASWKGTRPSTMSPSQAPGSHFVLARLWCGWSGRGHCCFFGGCGRRLFLLLSVSRSHGTAYRWPEPPSTVHAAAPINPSAASDAAPAAAAHPTAPAPAPAPAAHPPVPAALHVEVQQAKAAGKKSRVRKR